MNMKRRNFGLLAGTSLAALKFGIPNASAAADASLLTTTLTPMGAERAGNADGSIPAWTGGYNTPPAGWQVGDFMPDPYESDAVLVKIDASNMSQYASLLSAGAIAMMKKYPDFYINVYPTHRTACAPQDVYDNIALNVSRARPDPKGPQYGFLGAVGGIPFPILDTSDPLLAGAQCMLNNYVNWRGRGLTLRNYEWVVSNGTPYNSGESNKTYYAFPYYYKDANAANFGNGVAELVFASFNGPPNDAGEELITKNYIDTGERLNDVWELLNGQGRVRRAPEVAYDTPNSFNDGLVDIDESDGFSGELDRYQWHYRGKKEMIVPYNNNTLIGTPPLDAIGPHFINPQFVRWEKHRVHFVEATLQPGKRNTLPHRLFYVDEDTWQVSLTDSHDANDTLVHVNFVYNYTRPDLPGTSFANNSVHNMQTGDWTADNGPWDEKAHPSIVFYDSFPASIFDPNTMAASAQY